MPMTAKCYDRHRSRRERLAHRTADPRPALLARESCSRSASRTAFPVRVIRGSGHDSQYSPRSGYSYDGLYAVEDYWHEVGKSGFKDLAFPPGKDSAHDDSWSDNRRGTHRVFCSGPSRGKGVADQPDVRYPPAMSRRSIFRSCSRLPRSVRPTTARIRRTTSSACVRIITCYSTTAPSRSQKI